ncbi:hypothetical protein Taro_037401 [Colocasia esculenta]|uniref:Uncharacterized protein n=1 Tax=Colocasia esculenta TaxID=4460 RepID=A0A843WG57_COLES|nr:hypothetical protein [Colocasia esculenta]
MKAFYFTARVAAFYSTVGGLLLSQITAFYFTARVAAFYSTIGVTAIYSTIEVTTFYSAVRVTALLFYRRGDGLLLSFSPLV